MGVFALLRSASLLAVALLTGLSLAASAQRVPNEPGVLASPSAVGSSDPTCVPAWNPFDIRGDLPSTVQSSIRAADGYVYIGGRDGLYRMEGGTARAWVPNFSDPTALPAGRVEALAQFDGRLWVGTAAGLVRMDIETGELTRVGLNTAAGNEQSVTALMASQDTLFIGTNENIYTLSPGQDALANRITPSDGVPFQQVHAFAAHDSAILVATDRGLFRYSEEGSLDPLVSPAGDNAVVDLTRDNEGQIWAITPDQVLAPVKGQLETWRAFDRQTRENLPDDVFTSIAFDQTGQLWLGSRNGLSRSADDGQSFLACRRSTDAERDEGFAIGHIDTDLGPYVFIGSSGRGAMIAPIETNIRRIVPGERYNPGLTQAPIWSSAKRSDGRLLFGTTQGLFVERTANSGAFDEVAPAMLGTSRVYSILARDGEVWVGTNNGLFHVSTIQVARKVDLLRDEAGPVTPRVFTIRDSEAGLLLGTGSGLIVIDHETKEPIQFYRTNDEHDAAGDALTREINGNRVWSIDAQGTQALATGDTGSWAIDLAAAQVIASTDEAIADGRFNAGRIYSIMDIGQGQVLLGTEAGLVETTRDFSRFKSITEINGMVLKSVMATGRSSDGRLWIGVAGSGLFHRMPQEPSWQHISQADGLITNGISQLGLSFPSDGSVIASNATGASVIATAAMETKPLSRFRLEASEIFRGEVIPQDATFAVGPERRDMRIRFAVPELLAPGQYWVTYTLTLDSEVVEEEEVPLGEDLIFPRLEPGQYSLVGTLASASGVQSDPLTLSLRVNPFWWERQSTYVLLFIFVAGLIAAFFALRTRSIERKYQIIADERRRIAQELHDSSLQDLFGAQMLGRTLKIDGASCDAQLHKDQVLGLLKSATASMRASVMTLREDPDMPSLRQAIGEFSPPAALAQPIKLQFSENGKTWSVGKHRRFFVARIAQEAINNAAKHAHADNISTTLDWSFWNLKLEVEDDGEGFDPSSSEYKNGHGRDAMQHMAEAVGGTLEVTSRPDKGTRIRLKVPRFAL